MFSLLLGHLIKTIAVPQGLTVLFNQYINKVF